MRNKVLRECIRSFNKYLLNVNVAVTKTDTVRVSAERADNFGITFAEAPEKEGQTFQLGSSQLSPGFEHGDLYQQGIQGTEAAVDRKTY